MTSQTIALGEAIVFKGVKVSKGRRRTVGPIDLQIPTGHIVALVGPNGSGKSTIIKLMLKQLFPEEGEVNLLGHEAQQVPPLQIRQQIAYVAEHPIAEENFMSPDEAARFRSHWYPHWDQALYNRLIDRFQVPRSERLNKMSKGERRKFEIAVTLAARPKLLILDEPSSGLDPFSWKEMMDQLRIVMEEEEVTIVLSSHIVEEVKRLADYIVLVNSGQVLGMAEKDSLFATWKEIWLGDQVDDLDEIEEYILNCDKGPAMTKLIVRECEQLELWLRSRRIHLLKSRSLELDEILEIWIQGNMPEVILK